MRKRSNKKYQLNIENKKSKTIKRPAPTSTDPSLSISTSPFQTSPKPITNTQINTLNSKNQLIILKKLYVEEQLESRSNICTEKFNIPINLDTIRYTLENFSNKNINLHDLCKEIGINAHNVLEITETARPSLNGSIKTKMTRLANLSFRPLKIEFPEHHKSSQKF